MLPVNLVKNRILKGIPNKLVTRGLVADYRFDQKNLLKYSEDFSNAAWSKIDCTVSGNVIDVTSVNSTTFYNSATVLPSTAYTFSFKATAGTLAGANYAIYDVTNAGFIKAATAYNATGGQISWIFTTPAGCVSVRVYPVRYNGSTGTITITECQLERGSAPTAYEKTLANQTLWNRATTPMAVTNLITNGNFADTTGWGALFGTGTAANNVLTLTGDGTAQYITATQNTAFDVAINHVIYIRAKVKTTTTPGTNFIMKIDGSTAGTAVQTSASLTITQDVLYTLSASLTEAANFTGKLQLQIFGSYADAATAEDKVMEVKEVQAIDLTALFGAGNEPIQEVADLLFANWFDGTQNMVIPKYNGVLGSTTADDAAQPTWTGQGASFDGGDYVALPLSIDVSQDFTAFIVCDWSVSNPAGYETYWSVGSSSTDTPRITFGRELGNTDAFANMANNAGTVMGEVSITLPAGGGLRIFKIMRKNNAIYVKELTAMLSAIPLATVAEPMTVNQMTLGAKRGSSASVPVTRPEYTALFYNRATTDKEDKQNYKYLKSQMAQRGIVI